MESAAHEHSDSFTSVRYSTQPEQGRVLVIDDEPEMCNLVRDGASQRGFEVETAQNAPEALVQIETWAPDALLVDLRLGDASGLELCSRVHQAHPYLPVVVMTGFGSMQAAIDAIRAGAFDFLNKPVDFDELEMALRRAVGYAALQREVERLRKDDQERRSRLLPEGRSLAMRRVRDMIERVAESDMTVAITGESGTGKELVARSIHDASPCEGPFVAVNCAAVPATLLESELFGHEKGAFTDARRERNGLFSQARGGTLFLDEIGEMPQEMQVKLLRALQERRVRRVGGTEEVEFDARVIAATNRNLEEDVEQGRFREDLYYRLNVLRIEVPPLRDRGEDILLLAQTFLEDAAEQSHREVEGLSPEAAKKLLDYSWPGNVRELQNSMARAVALTRHRHIVVGDLPETISTASPARLPAFIDDSSAPLTMAEVERRYVTKVLRDVGGNKTAAARVLGFDRRTLYRKLERFERDG